MNAFLQPSGIFPLRYAGHMNPKPLDRSDWTAQQDLVIQAASREVAADKLGRTVEEVLARRTLLGLLDPLSASERRARQGKKKPRKG
jgi:hypothetical protein